MKFGVRKLESWGYHAASEEIMTLAFFVLTFDTIPARDRRTDGHVPIANTIRYDRRV